MWFLFITYHITSNLRHILATQHSIKYRFPIEFERDIPWNTWVGNALRTSDIHMLLSNVFINWNSRTRQATLRSSVPFLISMISIQIKFPPTVNGTDITNRGCTLISGDNQTAACTGLFDGWQVVGCDLCESNGCNAPIHSTVFAQTNSGSDTWGSWTTATLMLLATTVIG